MSNNVPQVDSILYIKEILVECSAEDGNGPKLEGLKLTMTDELNHYLNFTRISRTTWRQKENIPIRVAAHGLLLVASSNGYEDLGHTHIDLKELDNIQSGNRWKWNIEPVEDAPEISLSFEVHNLVLGGMKRRLETELADDDSSELYIRAQLFPDKDPMKAIELNICGGKFRKKFATTQKEGDIRAAIKAYEQAVAHLSADDPRLASFIADLGMGYSNCYNTFGQIADLNEAIVKRQVAVAMTPDHHGDLPRHLSNLGYSFLYRFERTGKLVDISDAIQLQQRAAQLTPDDRAELPARLNNLGISFLRRFEQVGKLADISEAIQLQQRAAQLTPDSHANFPAMLNNLGSSFVRRFERTGELKDISEAIQLQQRAVQLTPDGHSNLPSRLNNLGSSFLSRFEQTRELADISEAIQIQQQVAQLTPDGHAELPARLNNLGISLLHRFERTGELADISEAIRLQQRAVHLTPDGHAGLPSRLNNLGSSFLQHFERTQDSTSMNSALLTFHLSAMSPTGPPSVCLKASEKWAQLSKTKLPLFSSELLDAHGRIIHLLCLITGFEKTLKRRHELLIESSHLSTAAAAAALSVNRPDKALEWLEQGRCIVWNQINHLRTPIDDLSEHNPALADQLSLLSRQLEYAGSRTDPRKPGEMLSMDAKISLESEAHNHLKLTKKRDELLVTIRDIPGLKDFLQPRKYTDLMSRLPEDGPVIIINADKDRCDALALIAGCEEPTHIPLEQFSYERATILAEGLRNYLSSHQLLSRYPEEAVSDHRTLVPSKRPGSRDDLQQMLHALWTDLVEPILQSLAIKVTDDCSDLPRIWWCPTGPFAFLPIHAAGIYEWGKDAPGSCLADFAISSYIPSLSILDKLRSRTPSRTENGVLLVSQPNTPGLSWIPNTSKEVQKTREELGKRRIRSTSYESKDATVTVVSEALESFSCIHLACHASQEIKNPLESAIYLYDGPLKLNDIIKKDLPNADLAFMSACQTSSGAEKLPEEAVHLAAGMLAAGYRSVVATMWSISDTHAPQVAQTFYEDLLNNSTKEGEKILDVTGSARALHMAMRRLREELGDSPKSLLTWIPYIHFGI